MGLDYMVVRNCFFSSSSATTAAVVVELTLRALSRLGEPRRLIVNCSLLSVSNSLALAIGTASSLNSEKFAAFSGTAQVDTTTPLVNSGLRQWTLNIMSKLE